MSTLARCRSGVRNVRQSGRTASYGRAALVREGAITACREEY